MNIKPIRNEQDYEELLKRLNELWGMSILSSDDSPEWQEFELLSVLEEIYSRDHAPIAFAHSIEALDFYIKVTDRDPLALAQLLGSRKAATEVLTRKKPLTKSMIYKICRAWKIPAAALIKPYSLYQESS